MALDSYSSVEELKVLRALLLFVLLPAVATYTALSRSAWWKRRYLTTRVFLFALPGTVVWIGFHWSPAKDFVGGLLLFLTEIVGFIALIRWLVGLGSGRFDRHNLSARTLQRSHEERDAQGAQVDKPNDA
jgi:hypothetical protein